MIAFDNSKLRGRIVEKYGAINKFSEKTSKKYQFVCNVLNGRRMLNRDDMDEWITLLDVEPDEIMPIFFTKQVHIS